MKKKLLFAVAALGFAVAMSSAPAHAQDMGKITLFGGYSFQTNNAASGFCSFSDCFGDSGMTGLHGYTGSVVFNTGAHLGLEANFAGHNGTPTIFSESATSDFNGSKDVLRQDSYTYTFGPNLRQSVGHFSLFTHFLVGAAHEHAGFTDTFTEGDCQSDCTSSSTLSARGSGFAMKVGGGVDWSHGRLGVRILQVDYVHEALWTTVVCETDEDCDADINQPFHFRTSSNNFELATGITLSFGKR